MDNSVIVAVAALGLSIAGGIFAAGRFTGSLKRQVDDSIAGLSNKIEANERVQTERHALVLQSYRHLEGKVEELKESSIEKRNELRTTLDERMVAMTAEIMRLRDDRHNTVGTVMRHEGVLVDHGKQLAHLDTRVSRIEKTS